LAARKSPKQHEPSCGLVVVLPGMRRIEVHPDFDTSTFERLVDILERVKLRSAASPVRDYFSTILPGFDLPIRCVQAHTPAA